MSLTHQLARRGRLPDRLVRPLVRRRAIRRLRPAEAATGSRLGAIVDAAEVPAFWSPGRQPAPDDELADRILGRRGLEAAARWPGWAKTLDAAEDEMLGLIRERAEIDRGHSVLLVARRRAAAACYLAEETGIAPVVWTRRPQDAATIRSRGERIGLGALDARSGNLTEATAEGSFDRILVLESTPSDLDPRVFLTELGTRLRPGGRLLLQLGCHRRYAYRLSGPESLWLGLTGGLVPATDLAPRLATGLSLAHHWELSGEHYERTFRSWRKRLEDDRSGLVERAAESLGQGAARQAIDAWRVALLARETMFGARGGQEWWISQYALERPPR